MKKLIFIAVVFTACQTKQDRINEALEIESAKEQREFALKKRVDSSYQAIQNEIQAKTEASAKRWNDSVDMANKNH